MFVPDDSSCYCCCKLKELTESSPELSLSTIRQLIIELYPRLFRYQVWNLQSGQPLLHNVFNQGAQLNPFEYFCHVTGAFDEWGAVTKWSGVVKAVSVCNIAVVNAVSFLLKLELERFFNGQLPKISEPDWKRMISGENERYTMYVQAYVKNLREKVIFAVNSSSGNSLHALCLQTGKVFTSVSGCNFVLFKKEKQVGYLFRRDVEKRAVILKICLVLSNFFDGLEKPVAAMFSSSHTVTCISSDSVVAFWNFRDDYDIAFHVTSNFPLPFSPPAQASYETSKYVFSPDGEFIAFQQQNKIMLHCVAESNQLVQQLPCTIFETECGGMDARLKFSADSSLLFVCIQDGFKGPLFCVWDVKRESMSESFKSPGPPTVDCFCLSPDLNNLILCGGCY